MKNMIEGGMQGKSRHRSISIKQEDFTYRIMGNTKKEIKNVKSIN